MDCYICSMPSLTSRRFVRRVIAAIVAPVLLLSLYPGGILTIFAVDGAGMLPLHVKHCAWIVALPLEGYAEAGLPGVDEFERMAIAAYELGQTVR